MITTNETQAVVNLIEVVLQRGAIKGDELLQVAHLRQRFIEIHNDLVSRSAEPQDDAAEEAEASHDVLLTSDEDE